jgi:outer membrane immunogenic protein
MFAASAAQAADMALKAPPPAPVALWTGCSIGADAGWYGAHQSGTTTAVPSPGFGAPAINGIGPTGYGVLPTGHGLNHDGALGGLYTGCNYQSGKALFGVEGNFSWLDRHSSDAETVVGSFAGQPANFPPLGTNMQLNATNHWLASVRGRLGWIIGPTDNWLIYATGGAAFTDTSYSAVFTPSTNPTSLFGFGCPGAAATTCFGQSAVAFTQEKIGWVAGAGVEWMVAPRWLLRAEYLHYGFNGATGFVPAVFASGAAACAGCGWNAAWNRLDINSVRIGLSYKWY